MSDDQCNVAIIGAGNMAREHIRAFKDVPGVRIVGIHSRTRSKAKVLADEFNIGGVFDSIADLYNNTRPDLVILAVIETSMKSVCMECMNYPGTILMEKPPGLTYDESKTIEETARITHHKVLVGLNRRFLSSTRAAHADLASISHTRFIHVQDQQSLSQAKNLGHAGPVIHNWMYANSIHVIDYLRLFGRGNIKSITPIIPWNPDSSQVVVAKIEFSSGDIGMYEGIWKGPGPWAVSVTTPVKRWEMRPLEQAVFQNNGERTLQLVELHPWDHQYKPGFRLQADMAVAAALDKPSDSPTISEVMGTIQIIRGIFQQ